MSEMSANDTSGSYLPLIVAWPLELSTDNLLLYFAIVHIGCLSLCKLYIQHAWSSEHACHLRGIPIWSSPSWLGTHRNKLALHYTVSKVNCKAITIAWHYWCHLRLHIVSWIQSIATAKWRTGISYWASHMMYGLKRTLDTSSTSLVENPSERSVFKLQSAS